MNKSGVKKPPPIVEFHAQIPRKGFGEEGWEMTIWSEHEVIQWQNGRVERSGETAWASSGLGYSVVIG